MRGAERGLIGCTPHVVQSVQKVTCGAAMLLKVGGRTWQGSVGIHGRHLDDGARIRYISIDDQRQVIPVVDYTDDKGKTIEYVSSDIQVTKQQLAAGEHRSMDCVDCHNRPTHAFDLPEGAVNKQMAAGFLRTAFVASLFFLLSICNSAYARHQDKPAQPLKQDETCLTCHGLAGMQSEKGKRRGKTTAGKMRGVPRRGSAGI